MAIRLSDALQEAIREHGVREFPRECCGALLGDLVEGVKTVREVRPLPNTFEPSREFEQSVETTESAGNVTLHGQERRYMVSPQTMFELMQEERKTKRKVLGFYHSHPNHPARPSEYDRAWAMNWYSYVIVSVMEGKAADLTSWLLQDDGAAFSSELIETV